MFEVKLVRAIQKDMLVADEDVCDCCNDSIEHGGILIEFVEDRESICICKRCIENAR